MLTICRNTTHYELVDRQFWTEKVVKVGFKSSSLKTTGVYVLKGRRNCHVSCSVCTVSGKLMTQFAAIAIKRANGE